MTFVPDHERHAAGEIDICVVLGVLAPVKAGNPASGLLEFLHGPGDIDDLDDAKVLRRPCRRPGSRRGDKRPPVLRDDDAGHARSIRSAEKRAQVLRILDVVKD